MLSQKMEKALNEQISLEGYASYLYLSMASWADQQGLAGCSEFMHRQSIEEREHMLRLFHYINEVDGHAITPGIQQPPHEWKSIQVMFEEVYEHEKKVTKSINKLVDLSYKEQDHGTLNFLQWYVEEQREEEALMRQILDAIKLIGNGSQSLYFIDKEVAAVNATEAKKEAAE